MTVRLSDVDAIQLKNGKQLIEWLSRFSFFSPKKINVVTNSESRFRIHIYTDRNVYAISATNTYLGCTAATRTPRPGEKHTRGNDLPDGNFLEETFIRILGAILFYELKDVVKPIQRLPDEMEEIKRPEKIMSTKTFYDRLSSFVQSDKE